MISRSAWDSPAIFAAVLNRENRSRQRMTGKITKMHGVAGYSPPGRERSSLRGCTQGSKHAYSLEVYTL